MKRKQPMAVYVNKRTGKFEMIGISGFTLVMWSYIGYLILNLPVPL